MFICGGGGGGFEQFLRFTIFGLKINQIVDYTLQTYSATTARSAPILQGHFVGYMFCIKISQTRNTDWHTTKEKSTA